MWPVPTLTVPKYGDWDALRMIFRSNLNNRDLLEVFSRWSARLVLRRACTAYAHGAERYRASRPRLPRVRKGIEAPILFGPPWCGNSIEPPADFGPNGAETISGIVVGFGGSLNTPTVTTL